MMMDNPLSNCPYPFSNYPKEVQDYLQSCEDLLAAAALHDNFTLSKEQRAVIAHYAVSVLTAFIRSGTPVAVVGLTRELKDYTLYSMKKAGAFEVVDKVNAVVELYPAIERALGIDGKTADRPELGSGLGSMTEA